MWSMLWWNLYSGEEMLKLVWPGLIMSQLLHSVSYYEEWIGECGPIWRLAQPNTASQSTSCHKGRMQKILACDTRTKHLKEPTGFGTTELCVQAATCFCSIHSGVMKTDKRDQLFPMHLLHWAWFSPLVCEHVGQSLCFCGIIWTPCCGLCVKCDCVKHYLNSLFCLPVCPEEYMIIQRLFVHVSS